MKKYNLFESKMISSSKLQAIATFLAASTIVLLNSQNSWADNTLAQKDKTVEGLSGGFTDSQGCGFISDTPSYEMNIKSRVDYMRFTVEAAGGQPTLLVVGPNSGDSFCVLGDEISGLKPEISGVWEPGYYQIYVGDRTDTQHKFILDISTDN